MADTARAALASAVNLAGSHPLRTAALTTADQRQAVAKKMEHLIRFGPGPTRPGPRPPQVDTVSFDSALTGLAKRLRSSYSTTGSTQELLADVAATVLACSDLSDRMTLRAGHLSTQLRRVTRAAPGPNRAVISSSREKYDMTFANRRKR